MVTVGILAAVGAECARGDISSRCGPGSIGVYCLTVKICAVGESTLVRKRHPAVPTDSIMGARNGLMISRVNRWTSRATC